MLLLNLESTVGASHHRYVMYKDLDFAVMVNLGLIGTSGGKLALFEFACHCNDNIQRHSSID